MKFGILSSSSNSKLVETIKAKGHECRVFNPEKMYLLISEHQRGYDRLFYGTDGDTPERITANSIDCIINRIGGNTAYAVSVLQFMTDNLGIYCPNKPEGLLNASNKAKTLQMLSAAHVSVPKTIVTQKPAHVKWLVEQFGVPIVIKKTTGSQGDTVGIVDTKMSANSMFEFVYNSGINAVIEEYIEAESSDYRVWTVGDKVALAMKRTAKKGEWKANISKGGSGEKAYLSNEDKELCVKAAHSIGLIGYAGVDMLKDKKTGKSVIIEVNSNPGTKIIDITGVNVWKDLITFCEKNYKKGNTNVINKEVQKMLNMVTTWFTIKELNTSGKEFSNLFLDLNDAVENGILKTDVINRYETLSHNLGKYLK